jgi:hypothetical protein
MRCLQVTLIALLMFPLKAKKRGLSSLIALPCSFFSDAAFVLSVGPSREVDSYGWSALNIKGGGHL